MNPNVQTDLFAMLKRETATVHEKVMEESWAQRLLSADYTWVEYRNLLQKHYSFYLPLETLLSASLCSPLYSASRVKHPLLQADLAFLAAPVHHGSGILPKLPIVDGVPSALGVCYVLEGATLGGQMIAKHLRTSLGMHHSEGLSFFTGYGGQTGQMWNGFKSQACDIVRTPRAATAMLAAALETFDALSDWMESS